MGRKRVPLLLLPTLRQGMRSPSSSAWWAAGAALLTGAGCGPAPEGGNRRRVGPARHVAWGDAKGIARRWMESVQRRHCTGWIGAGSSGLSGRCLRSFHQEKGETTSSIREMSCGRPLPRPQPQAGEGPPAARLAEPALPPPARLVTALGSSHSPPAAVKRWRRC